VYTSSLVKNTGDKISVELPFHYGEKKWSEYSFMAFSRTLQANRGNSQVTLNNFIVTFNK
jgi:hypothetical protein